MACRYGIGLSLLGLLAFAGCDAPQAEFKPNLLYTRAKLVKSNRDLHKAEVRVQLEDIADILTALMGTPDDPRLPVLPNVDLGSHLQLDQLRRAAGAVGSTQAGTEHGLYRQHCVHCHGITGDGLGPTAPFLNPYPRDYRRGLFKFKSTPTTLPPTKDDLHRILREGVAGTAMPSFKVLTEDEREALVQYVMYLSIRGQIERALIYEISENLDVGERLIDLSLKTKDPEAFQEQLDVVLAIAADTVAPWLEANENITEVPPPPENWNTAESIAEGKRLFFTSLASCSKCHGDLALGDGQTNDYDEWTKELQPGDEDALAEFLALGALPPRNILPRNLRQGVYRGGRRPVDLFWRIKNGIAGTPMPAASQELTNDQIWHLIAYVRSLPYDAIALPRNYKPAVPRERL